MYTLKHFRSMDVTLSVFSHKKKIEEERGKKKTHKATFQGDRGLLLGMNMSMSLYSMKSTRKC